MNVIPSTRKPVARSDTSFSSTNDSKIGCCVLLKRPFRELNHLFADDPSLLRVLSVIYVPSSATVNVPGSGTGPLPATYVQVLIKEPDSPYIGVQETSRASPATGSIDLSKSLVGWL